MNLTYPTSIHCIDDDDIVEEESKSDIKISEANIQRLEEINKNDVEEIKI